MLKSTLERLLFSGRDDLRTRKLIKDHQESHESHGIPTSITWNKIK